MRKLLILLFVSAILLFVSCELESNIEVAYNIDSNGRLSLSNSGATLPSFLEIPSTVNGIEVKSFSSGMFKNHTELEYVYFMDCKITAIPEEAFQGCNNMLAVFISPTVTEIGVSAFEECGSLMGVDISSVERLGDRAFMDCSSLKQVTIGENLKYRKGSYILGNNIFVGCNSLETFEVDSKNTVFYTIDEKKGLVANYNGKIKLISYPTASGAVTLPDNITVIDSAAFSGCIGLTSVNLPDNLKTIESTAFNNCTSLTSISIPSSVTSISGDAFRNCTCPLIFEEGRIDISDSINLSKTAFEYIAVPASVQGNLSGFAGCSCPIRLTGERTEIQDYFFQYCNHVPSITIPDSVNTIGYNAFEDCTSLTTITIPKNVTRIMSYTFSGCSNLKTVYLEASNCSLDSNAFEYCYLSAIYVPADKVDSYKEAANWSSYSSIIRAIPTT